MNIIIIRHIHIKFLMRLRNAKVPKKILLPLRTVKTLPNISKAHLFLMLESGGALKKIEALNEFYVKNRKLICHF